MPVEESGTYSIAVFRAFARESARLESEHRFDAIHSQGFAAYLLPGRLAPKLAVTIHGTLTSETPLGMPEFARLSLRRRISALWRMKGRLASAPLYARLLRMARVLIVDSKFTQGELLRERHALEGKIVVAPLGIHPERVPPARPPRLTERPIRLLSVGRLTEAKGFHTVIAALATLPPEGWRWTLAGDGPQAPRLREAARRSGLLDRVEFPGEIAEDRLARLYVESDLFLYPELAQPAFGLVALEALLAGLPVVASDRGAIPEVVRPDGGWLFPAGDAAALGRRLKDLAANPGLIHEKARLCRAAALERFPFETMIETTRAALGRCGA